MKPMRMGKSRRGAVIWICTAAVVIAVLLWFFSALGGVQKGQNDEGRQQLEDALRRAAVACYAAEGVYPPDTEYIAEHYGVQIDEERYTVFYEIFADNLMPDITVMKKDKK